ncbi:MAG: hypothetical protein IPK39_12015 [Sulfuritalea sp.]|nr:hypothetical protein [Sulfuritalea sp.]
MNDKVPHRKGAAPPRHIPDSLRQRLRTCQKISPAFRREAASQPSVRWDWHGIPANPNLVRIWPTQSGRAAPNAGHAAVARLAGLVPHLTVITQNIDNLHQAAGSRDVLELHGNLFRMKAFVDADEIFAGDRSPIICPVCDGYALDEECDPYAGREDLVAIELRPGPVPRCPGCRALLRPDMVWFGEPLAADVLDAAWAATDACDLLICIGSSLEVQPAASLPWRAKWRGAVVIENQPGSDRTQRQY